MAFIQEIQYDAEGNNLNTNFTDYLVPTSFETPHWETGNTVTPSPHHPMGAKGVGESPNVGSPRRSSTPSSMRCRRWACGTSTCRHARQGVARDPRRGNEGLTWEGDGVNLQYTGEEKIPAGLDAVWRS